jgi:hypothetical protein
VSARGLRRTLQRAAGRHPRQAVAAATAVGWATRPLRRGVGTDALRRFLPQLQPAELRRLRGATWSTWLRLRAMEAALASPTAAWPYPPLVLPDLAELRPPLVIAGFHLGPMTAVAGLLEQLPGEVLVLQFSGAPRQRLTMLPVGTDQWQRASAFRRAIDTLRDDGFVFVLVDANEAPSTVVTTAFGRGVRLARGAFALARVTGAPVVPVAAYWRGGRAVIVAGDPIAPDDEHRMADTTAAWLERFVRAHPEVIGPRFVNAFWGDER